MNQNLQKQLDYWEISSKRDLETCHDLFKLKRYDSCLFFGHLALEKIIKGLILIQTQKVPPYIHDLEKLSRAAKLQPTDKDRTDLRNITKFNISGRYQEEKLEFYKKCNKEYTQQYLKIIKKLYLWLKKQYPKN